MMRDGFEPARFNIVLMNEASEEIIISARCQENPQYIALMIVEDKILPAGDYIVLVEAIFSDRTPSEQEYKWAVIDVYCA